MYVPFAPGLLGTAPAHPASSAYFARSIGCAGAVGGAAGGSEALGLTMLREVSCIPACDARPAEPIIILPGVDDTAVCDLTMFFDESTIPLWLAQPCDPLPRKVAAPFPASSCSCVNSRAFASASLAPRYGPAKPATFWETRPSEWMLVSTAIMSLFSYSATVWKRSCFGTPSFEHASR